MATGAGIEPASLPKAGICLPKVSITCRMQTHLQKKAKPRPARTGDGASGHRQGSTMTLVTLSPFFRQ